MKQPLEIYEVEETGELVLKHTSRLKDALVSHKAIMITNHDDKTIALWIGKEANTRVKFAAARSSRRYLTERSLSYRVRTCDEGEEPEWFQNLFTLKIASRSRDEPPSLEVLSILNEMRDEPVPEGYEREACIISRDFFVPVEMKSSILGKDTSTVKFEKSSYIPEGFFTLPSESYRPRLLVRNGKILAIDFLVNTESTKKEMIIDKLKQDLQEKTAQLERMQNELTQKNTQIESLEKSLEDETKKIGELEQKLKTLEKESGEKAATITTLQQQIAQKEKKIESLNTELDEKTREIQSMKAQIKESDGNIATLEKELSQKEAKISKMKQEITENQNKLTNLEQKIKEQQEKLLEYKEKLDLNSNRTEQN
ncbi:MAG: hypothetical protein ACTSRS_18770 [Candidatus Helarchaeota archaeon]